MKRVAASLLASSIDRLSRVGAWVATIAVIMMMLMVTLEVILRYFFRTSTLAADEFGGYFLVVVVFMGAAYTLRMGGHVKVEVLTSRLSLNTRYFLYVATSVLTALVCIPLVWQAWKLVMTSYSSGITSGTIMNTPQSIPQAFIGIGLSLLVLQAAVQIFKKS